MNLFQDSGPHPDSRLAHREHHPQQVFAKPDVPDRVTLAVVAHHSVK